MTDIDVTDGTYTLNVTINHNRVIDEQDTVSEIVRIQGDAVHVVP